MTKSPILKKLYPLIFEKLFKKYITGYKNWQLWVLVFISKKIGDVMNAERLYYEAPDNSPQEWRASINAMSFW